MKKIKKLLSKKIKRYTTKDGEKAIKITFASISYLIAIVLVIAIMAGSILAYGTNTAIGQRIAAKISMVLPFPAAIVDHSHFISLNDLDSNMSAVEKYYQSKDFSTEGLRVDFSTPEGQKRLEIKRREILDKMVEDQIIEILAKQKGITISDADVDKAVTSKLDEFGTGKDIKQDLLNSYGWSVDDFKKKVVLPSMYENALEKIVVDQNTDNSQAKQKITLAQQQLTNGKDFAQVVNEFSEGASKDKGGELGWVKKDQVLPELQQALFLGQAPAKNSIIESSIGYHIIDIESKKKENGEDVLQLRQIFVSKNTFADWLGRQKQNISVWVPMKEFTWDKASGSVQFRDLEMRKFEQDQRAKAEGDASIIL